MKDDDAYKLWREARRNHNTDVEAIPDFANAVLEEALHQLWHAIYDHNFDRQVAEIVYRKLNDKTTT